MKCPQLFSGGYQMILDVFRCSQLFSVCTFYCLVVVMQIQLMSELSSIQVWWLWSNSIFKLTSSFMIWWSSGSFQMKVLTLMIQRNSMIPVIRWILIFQSLRWYPRWSCNFWKCLEKLPMFECEDKNKNMMKKMFWPGILVYIPKYQNIRLHLKSIDFMQLNRNIPASAPPALLCLVEPRPRIHYKLWWKAILWAYY